MPTKNFVEVTAYWGNDDASSTIKISSRKWEKLKAGARLQKSAWSYYEGRRYSVLWSFVDGQVTIDGEDCSQHVVDLPVEELIVFPMHNFEK